MTKNTMQITLRSVTPAPLAGKTPPESIWQGMHSLESPGRYLIRAHSGRGKTTLVHLLYGIRTDYEGNISFDGKDIREYSLTDWSGIRQRQLSIVFQDLALFPDLTVRQNFLLKYNLSTALAWNEIEEMAAALGIGEKLDQKCRLLSYGQQQRVAIIRSLIQPFRFLLLDEPFSNLDTVNTKKALSMILERCKAQNAGLVLTSLGEDYGLDYGEVFVV